MAAYIPVHQWHVGPTVDILLIARKVKASSTISNNLWKKRKADRVRFQDSMAAHSPAPLPPSFRGTRQSKPKFLNSTSLPSNPPLIVSLPYHHRQRKALRISASVSFSNPEVRTGPGDLVASILSKVCPFLSSLISLWFLP